MEKYKVLVIEDDDTAREQLAKVIRKEGFQVLVAENGRAGLEVFKKELPEIVVSDLKMPDIDGLEVIHTVRRLSTNVQVILITAFGETETAIAAIREGALDYLEKPLDLEQLTLALGRARERIVELRERAFVPALLLADDEDKIRERLSREMEKEGWQVFAAADGEEAISLFKVNKIDIVILDIKMPKKDGLQALHEMRSMNDDFETIILTGHGDEDTAIQALRDGAINFLKKPIDLEQLILSVEKGLEKLQAERALKYRTRDLELATEIIGCIGLKNQILIDLRRGAPKSTRDFAQKLIDLMPMGLLVLNRDMTIVYMNRYVAQALQYRPEKVDEEFVKSVGKMGIKDLSYESLMSAVNTLSSALSGTVETISTGKYSYITLAPMRIVREEEQENAVLIIIRGERCKAS
ncbi:MAG: response regulator [Desulfobacterales bacterium]|nr:response regulator [Desulfobacterales bacterium]